MGFWHTGYMEFHEPIGLDKVYEPRPPIFPCQHCEAIFLTDEELRTHRFEKHPYNRPVLFVRGIEVGTNELNITRRLSPNDISIDQATWAEFNGEQLSISSLRKRLAAQASGTAIVTLGNTDLSAPFRLRFNIAMEQDLAGVDQSLRTMSRRNRLDMRAIEDFIEMASSFRSAGNYCDGICAYLYGVLAKEGAGDSSLPHDEYRLKFGQAAESLRDIQRPIADILSALIAFHFNQFEQSVAMAPPSRLRVVASRFHDWIDGSRPVTHHVPAKASIDPVEALLTDSDTERILRWGITRNPAIGAQLPEIEAYILRDIAEFDRSKLHIFLAEVYAERGVAGESRRHARELLNNPSLSIWANRLIKSLPKDVKRNG